MPRPPKSATKWRLLRSLDLRYNVPYWFRVCSGRRNIMLTKKQHELICFINDRLADTGVSPSFEEMKEALDLKSKSGVHRLISALEERQFLRRVPNRARALEVLKMPERAEKRAVTAQPKPNNFRPAPEP